MKQTIERIFSTYRKHKYYTLFLVDYDTQVTTNYDRVGGRSNSIPDQTANTAIKLADTKTEAKEYVEQIERAVEQLPELEQKVIRYRYMCKDYDYISDYYVYNFQVPMSANTYRKVRNRAFRKLHDMLLIKK